MQQMPAGRSVEAILLVGGAGTRLRPLTIATPKPLLLTAGLPLLEHLLVRAHQAGVRRLVFATCYRAEMFADSFGDGSRFDMEIVYVTEEEPLGTAGALRNAMPALTAGDPDDPILVLNGDILSDHDISAQLALHEKADAAVTLHLIRVPDAQRYGSVPTDGAGRVLEFVEKSPDPPTDQVNAGCYVFRRSVLERIPTGRPVSVEFEVFPALLAEGMVVMSYLDDAHWLDVGTPEAFVEGSCDLVLGRIASPAMPVQGEPALVAAEARVDPGAVVDGGSVIGAGTTVGPGCTISRSVLFDRVVVEPGVEIRGSVVGTGARIGPGVVLDGVVIGDRVNVGAGNELRGGARIWPETVLTPGSIRFSSDQ